MQIRYISRIFLRGIIVLLPLILTIYPLIYFFSWIDTLTRKIILWIFPGFHYIPGSGIIIGMAMIFLLGLLMSSRHVRKLYSLLEIPLKNIPLVKSLYTAVRELTKFLASADDEKAERVVAVTIPDQPIQIIGFVMQDDLSGMPDEIEKENRVAVYVPMSYQVGGFTLFISKDWITPVNMTVDRAMKNILTGWMTGEDTKDKQE